LARKRDSAKEKSGRRRSSSAAGSYRGFSLQATRFLHHLLAPAPPEFVCLEVFEDVSAHKSDGKVSAEQTKSYKSSNPLADRSVELWKTLRNWVDAVSRGVLDSSRTSFVLYAPNTKPGDLAQLLGSSVDSASIAAAITKITELGKEEGSAEWHEHAKIVAAADTNLVGSIIKNFCLESPTGSPAKTLSPLLEAKLVSSDVADDVLNWAHGWIKTTVDALLERREPARVCYADFHSALLEFVKSHDRLVVLRSYAGAPNITDVHDHLTLRCYVRQLRIIDLDDVDVLEAVNDYLRSSVDRTEWARRGFITEGALADFEHELLVTWRNKKRKVTLGHSTAPLEEQGQLLYADCMDHSLALDGHVAPPAFLRGSLHSIADDCTIGWHPDYVAMLALSPSKETVP
jgi:hypothetical protein